jgi:WD40 repeat protein
LAVGSFDGLAVVWNVATGREICSFKGHRTGINAMAFSPDGRRLATGGKDGTAKLWDLESRQAEGRSAQPVPGRTFRGHIAPLRSVAFSPNGEALATASFDGTVKVWDTGRPQETPALKDYFLPEFSPDGKVLVTRGRGHTVTLWDVATLRQTRTLPGPGGWTGAIAFVPGGKMLATGSRDGTVTLWDVATGHAARTQTLREHERSVRVAFSPDVKTLATWSEGKIVTLWEMATGRKRWTRGHYPSEGGVFALVFSPDGRTLAIAGGQSRIDLLDAATGRTTRSLVVHTETVSSPVFTVSSLAFSADGQMLAAGSWDSTATLWDLATGRRIHTFKHTSLVDSVAFSPDGRRLTTGTDDGAVKLWDVVTGREMLTLGGLTLDTDVAFSPDGRRLAASGALNGVQSRGAVLLWEAATPQEVAAREAREGAATARR